MNDQNCPFYLDTLDQDFVSWFASLSPEDRQLFVDMCRDTDEMLDEGYEPPDVRQYIERNYGAHYVY